LGLKSAGALRTFCEELAEDTPSPGGGSAAAAAGAMAASLLAMVCGITAKSRKYAERAQTMVDLRSKLLRLQGRLLENARNDAEAYDDVLREARRRRESPGDEAQRGYESALKRAAEVPMRTAEACAEVLDLGRRVAELGSKSTYSDVGTALHLADAGLQGAVMNVRINLDLLGDEAYRTEAGRKAEDLSRLADVRKADAWARLRDGGGG